jgi:hypothetical protein
LPPLGLNGIYRGGGKPPFPTLRFSAWSVYSKA